MTREIKDNSALGFLDVNIVPEEEIMEQLSRSGLAASVSMPIELWEEVLKTALVGSRIVNVLEIYGDNARSLSFSAPTEVMEKINLALFSVEDDRAAAMYKDFCNSDYAKELTT